MTSRNHDKDSKEAKYSNHDPSMRFLDALEQIKIAADTVKKLPKIKGRIANIEEHLSQLSKTFQDFHVHTEDALNILYPDGQSTTSVSTGMPSWDHGDRSAVERNLEKLLSKTFLSGHIASLEIILRETGLADVLSPVILKGMRSVLTDREDVFGFRFIHHSTVEILRGVDSILKKPLSALPESIQLIQQAAVMGERLVSQINNTSPHANKIGHLSSSSTQDIYNAQHGRMSNAQRSDASDPIINPLFEPLSRNRDPMHLHTFESLEDNPENQYQEATSDITVRAHPEDPRLSQLSVLLAARLLHQEGGPMPHALDGNRLHPTCSTTPTLSQTSSQRLNPSTRATYYGSSTETPADQGALAETVGSTASARESLVVHARGFSSSTGTTHQIWYPSEKTIREELEEHYVPSTRPREGDTTRFQHEPRISRASVQAAMSLYKMGDGGQSGGEKSG